MLLREFFLKWCNLVRFGVYFDFKKFQKLPFFYINFFLNLTFLYTRINILDTRLLWGNNYSRKKISGKLYD